MGGETLKIQLSNEKRFLPSNTIVAPYTIKEEVWCRIQEFLLLLTGIPLHSCNLMLSLAYYISNIVFLIQNSCDDICVQYVSLL